MIPHSVSLWLLPPESNSSPEQERGSSKRVHDGEPGLSFVDNIGPSRGQAVKCFVFGFEFSLGLRRCGRTMCGKYGLTGASGIECRISPSVLVRWPHLREISANEWIDDAHAGVHEIGAISRGDRQTVDDRSRRDEAILDRHGFSGCAKTRQQLRPFQPRVRVPRQDSGDARPPRRTSVPGRPASFPWEGSEFRTAARRE
jgi:hypothetical protein